MNIYTVTFLNPNYGSILQAFALQSRLKEFGAEPCVLQKKTARSRYGYYRKLSGILQLFMPKENYSFLKKCYLLLDGSKYRKKYAKISEFVKKNLRTFTVEDESSFQSKITDEDLFLAGSDQVWNTCNPVSPWYSFKWVNGNHEKYSYAASIAKSALTDNQIRSYTAALAEFKCISLREKQAFDLLEKVFSNQIRQDVDPTLLYDGAFWRKFASPRLIKEPYIFVYRLRPNDDIFQLAKKISHEKGFNIYYTGLCGSHTKDIHTIYDAGVEDFLSLILHAEIVLTNSFHGTVFSILFERPFLSVNIASSGSRIESLLSKLDLSGQLVNNIDDNYSLEVDYSNTNEILTKERCRSIEYLKNICERKI